MANRRGNVEVVTDFLFLGSRITADGDYSHEIRRLLLFGRKTMINLDSMLKNRHDSADQGLYSQGYGRPSGHIWLWELNRKEGRMPKNWCIQTVVLEKTLESPLDSKDIWSVSPKGNQPWIFTGRNDAEAEAPIHWPPDAKNLEPLEKTLMLGKIEGGRRSGWQRMRRLDGITDSIDMNLSKPRETVKDGEAWHAAVHGIAKSQPGLSHWNELVKNLQKWSAQTCVCVCVCVCVGSKTE